MNSWKFEAIGTQWEIDIRTQIDVQKLEDIKKRVSETITDFDRYFSRFIPNSFVSSLAHKKGTIQVNEDFVSMLWMYLPLYFLTDGTFTPLIGSLLDQAGYDKDYSLQEKPITDIPALTDVVEVLDPTHIELKQPVLFDFGAIGKGYLVEKVADILRSNGINDFTVDGSGDILVEGSIQLKIGLENPFNTKQIIGTIALKNKAICGSAGNRRKWGRFHHIINPKTKTSPKEIEAVWVVANSCALADGLSTALFFVSPEALQKQFQFEYLIITKDMRIAHSKDLQVELFQ